MKPININKGFTLIELMIVVAIIAILATIALPTYFAYIATTQVAEAFSLVHSSQSSQINAFSVGKCLQNGDDGVASAEEISGKYIESVTFNGTLVTGNALAGSAFQNTGCGATALFRATPPVSSKLTGKKIAFSLMRTSGAYRMTCLLNGGSVPTMPATNVDNKLLPATCE